MVLDLDSLFGGGPAMYQDLAEAVQRFRASGKRVIAMGDSYDQGPFFVAAHADEVLMHPMGIVFTPGYGVYRNYFKEALDYLDAESAAPIEGMEVRMQGLSVITDSAGWFSLRQLRPGEHVIEFEHVGYGEGHARIEVPERRETIAQFRMPAQAVDLGELTVRQRSREEAARRMLPVGTQVLDVGELEEAAARGARVGDALRDLSGLDIYYGAFYGPGHENRKADIVCI